MTSLIPILAANAVPASTFAAQGLWNHFLLGGIVAMCLVVGLKFLVFWRKTHDRLFAIFAIAFWTLGFNWLALAIINQDEARTILYVVRLLAFLVILWGIIDKNRSRPSAGSPNQSNLLSPP